MVVLDGRRDGGSRTELAVEVKRMAAFINAPAIILTAPDQMRRFPKVLAVVAGPDLASLFIDAQAPGIAQTVSPVLRSRVGHSNKWIVLRHRVSLCSVRMIDIDAQHATEKLAQILSRVPSVRIARAVAGRDVKHSVMAEHKAAAVMSL